MDDANEYDKRYVDFEKEYLGEWIPHPFEKLPLRILSAIERDSKALKEDRELARQIRIQRLDRLPKGKSE